MKLILTLVAGVSLLLSSCDDEINNHCEVDEPIDTAEVHYAYIQTEVFNKSCAFSGCHVGDNFSTWPNLTEGAFYDFIVTDGKSRQTSNTVVVPGDATNSYLIKKLKGSSTSIMPPNTSGISPILISKIERWINNGAKQ